MAPSPKVPGAELTPIAALRNMPATDKYKCKLTADRRLRREKPRTQAEQNNFVLETKKGLSSRGQTRKTKSYSFSLERRLAPVCSYQLPTTLCSLATSST